MSVIFVSLGAPFWHDLLESVFGLKVKLGTREPKPEGEDKGDSGTG